MITYTLSFLFAWWEKAQYNTEQISKQQQQFLYTRLAIFEDKMFEQNL